MMAQLYQTEIYIQFNNRNLGMAASESFIGILQNIKKLKFTCKIFPGPARTKIYL